MATMQTEKRYPVDDLTYDVITILHEKSKALEAYDKYLRDAQGDRELCDLLTEIRRGDEQHVEQLKKCLGRILAGQSQQAPLGADRTSRGSAIGIGER